MSDSSSMARRSIRPVVIALGLTLAGGVIGGGMLAGAVRSTLPKPYEWRAPALAELGAAERARNGYEQARADGTLVERRGSSHWGGLRTNAAIVDPAVQPAFSPADYQAVAR
ncbi:hypothetical protein ACPVPU_12830 [Sphingomonas sp. CJ99]